MRRKLEQFAHRTWRKKGLVSAALLPLSWLAGAAVRRRRRRFAKNGSQYRSRLPVVVVGNIYVGGTGKTPVVIALVRALREKGWVPGVVSRGYGRTESAEPLAGRGGLDSARFGDEPALIAQATGAPVCVHRMRAAALRHLEQAYPDVNVVIADDGLQHLALARDIEIVVQDARGVGNGRLLPAGPLREPAGRLERVDYIITNLQPGEPQPPPFDVPARQVAMQLRPTRMRRLVSGADQSWESWLAQNGGAAVGALAGIGQPERFFGMLRSHGLRLARALPLPDHAALDAPALDLFGDYPILMTAKDAVKCAGIDDPRIWVVHADPVFSDAHWLDDVSRQLQRIASDRNAVAGTDTAAPSPPY
jgi:tetraacyldisaccharide 4'-kinase